MAFKTLRHSPSYNEIQVFQQPANGSGVGANEKTLGISLPFKSLIMQAYGVHREQRLVLNTELPVGNFDYISNLASGSGTALQQEIKKQFSIIAHFEARPKDVLLLKVKDAEMLNLKLTPRKPRDKAGYWREGNKFYWGAQSSSRFVEALGDLFSKPVVDATSLTNLQNFNFDLDWDLMSSDLEKLKQALKEDGFELISTNQSIPMLVVEKVK